MSSSPKLGNLPDELLGLDRISNLPDELLGHLLSFLPTSCAVSTSILSTRWRYLFTLTNCLSFEESPSFKYSAEFDEMEAARERWFKKFVYRVLDLHQVAPIKKFSLVCLDCLGLGIYDNSDLNAWVSKAVQKGVQELHYQVNQLWDVLPDSLFTCETLVTLKIIVCYHGKYEPCLPSSVSLPRLKILHLQCVRIWCPMASSCFLAGVCESLEELTLKHGEFDTECHVIISFGVLKALTIKGIACFGKGLFEIDAPNLAYLNYSLNLGVKIVPSWKYSSSLVMANLEFYYTATDASDHNSIQYDRGLVKAAAYKATELHLFGDSFELLLSVAEHKEMPDVRNLTNLHLGDFPYYKWKYVTSLLEKSPQLETLVFILGLHRCSRDPESPPFEALIPFSCEAKVIEVDFCGHECSLILLGHLLRNARVLKKLILAIRIGTDMEEQRRIRKAVLMLPRASSDCCIKLKLCNNFMKLISM